MLRHRLANISEPLLKLLRAPKRKFGISDINGTICISKSVVILLLSAIFVISLGALLPVAVVTTNTYTYHPVRNVSAKHSPTNPRLKISDYAAKLVDDSEPYEPSAVIPVEKRIKRNSYISPSISEHVVPSGIGLEDEPNTRLIVLTMNRVQSLQRLLRSLEVANYGEDQVDIDIWIDKSNEKPIDIDVLDVARLLTWKHGVKTIHQRTENAGLYQQWLYTWNITDETTEAAVILEDDLEVSPSFYQWLSVARAAYSQDGDVGAFTLQRSTLRPRQIRGVASGPLNLDKEHVVFKYLLPGTWGFAPERDQWLEFREWFEDKKSKGEKPYVKDLMTTDWYKSQEVNGFAPTMWSQWWIKFVDEKRYFTVTAHLPDGSTLAANWREKGLHYSKNKASVDFPLFTGNEEQFVMLDNPILVDWDGMEIKRGSAAGFGAVSAGSAKTS